MQRDSKDMATPRGYFGIGIVCSCYGLEGQWEPEETTWEALAMREFYGDQWIKERIAELAAERGAEVA
jgi:hypothetical protein